MFGASDLAISVSLWLLYFDHPEHVDLSLASTRLWAWTHNHFPFVMGITVYGVVGNKSFAAAPGQPLGDTKRMLFTSALAVAVLSFRFIEWATKEKDEPLSRKPQPLIRLLSAVVLLVLGVVSDALNVGWLVAIVFSIFLAQVGLDFYARLLLPVPVIQE